MFAHTIFRVIVQAVKGAQSLSLVQVSPALRSDHFSSESRAIQWILIGASDQILKSAESVQAIRALVPAFDPFHALASDVTISQVSYPSEIDNEIIFADLVVPHGVDLETSEVC